MSLRSSKCNGKVRHRSERRAADVAKESQKYYGNKMRAYECEFCAGFHVGSIAVKDGHQARIMDERDAATTALEMQ